MNPIFSVPILVKPTPPPQTLTPGLFTNAAPTFYAPAVAAGPVTLTPSLVTNNQSFNTHAVAAPGADQALTPPLFYNWQNFALGTPEYVITPIVITQGGATQTLTPGLFTDADSFFGPTIATGPIALLPTLWSNTQTFPAATVAPATWSIQPVRLDNAQTFPAAVVSASYTLSPPFFTNDQNFLLGDAYFFPPTVTQGGDSVLLPVKFDNTQTFPPAAVSSAATVAPIKFTNVNSFPPAAVAASSIILPPLFTNSQTFPPAIVGAAAIILLPTRYSDPDTLFTPHVITVGGVGLYPAMYDDPDSFFPATLTGGGVAALGAGRNHPFHANLGQLTDRT